MAYPSLRASLATAKVDPGTAIDRGTARNFSPATCPASAFRLNYDVYGRDVGVSRTGIPLLDSACSGCVLPASQFIAYEDALRPYITFAPYPIAGEPARYDTIHGHGNGRVQQGKIYPGGRGSFQQAFVTERQPVNTALINTGVRIGVDSHDAGVSKLQ